MQKKFRRDLELGTDVQAHDDATLTEDLQQNTNNFNYSLYDDLDLPRWDSAMLCAAISRMKNPLNGDSTRIREQSPSLERMQSDTLTKRFDLPYPAYGSAGPIRLGGSGSV